MIQYVDELLNRWGRWAIRSYTGSLGYAPFAPSCRDYRPPVTEARREYDPGWAASDIHDCETAVKLLPQPHRRIIVCAYVERIPRNQIAREMGLHRNTIRVRIDEAHIWIARDLEGRDYGEGPVD